MGEHSIQPRINRNTLDDEECNEMMDRLVKRMVEREGVTEQRKSDDWLCWLQKMNSIRSRAEEVVLHDLVYSL